tara:strand:- start:2648 stop:5560 length:2913 start_codon:yes stop_codon:yes gene_type:complete
MGVITIRTDQGDIQAQIAGDTPTESEMAKIKEYVASQSAPKVRTFEDVVSAVRKERYDPNFDYETGADSGLRALVSFGETDEERELILRRAVGADGYTRDDKGNLALTEKGQKIRGIDYVGKNLVLEDKGFSFGDVADLTGIVPETVGSVIGGIMGAGAGLGWGSVATGAAGAAAGAAVGQTAEESIEALLGIQKQSLGEIASDVATEAAIAGTIDLVTVGTFKAVRGVVGGTGRLVSKPLTEATEEGAERGLRLIDEGAAPSLERLGAPRTIAYAQKLSEGATSNINRQLKNTEFALNKADELKRALGEAADVTDAGDAFANVTSRQFNQLKIAQKEAEEAAMRSVKDSINVIERSLDEGFDVNDEVLGSIINSFQNFSRQSGREFSIMDNLLAKLEFTEAATGIVKEGGKARVIPTNLIEGAAKDLEELAGSRAILPSQVQQVIRGVEEMAKKQKGVASFEQIANQRKIVNDALFEGNLSASATEQLFKLRNAYDQSLDSFNLNSIKGIRPDQKKLFAEIGEQRERAFRTYREGLKVFDDLQKFGIVRSMKNAAKDPRFSVDQFFKKVIRPNSPERLKAVLGAVDDPDLVRAQLARSYLDDAMQRTGIDVMSPNTFNGMRFKAQIDSLGSTGKVLFGDQWGQVKNLSKAIAEAGPNRIDADIVARIAQTSPDGSMVAKLQELVEAKKALGTAEDLKVVRDFNAGVLSPEDAARYLVNPSRSVTEINKFIRFFQKDPEALDTIRRYAINEIVSTVGDDVFSSTGKALELDRLVNKTYKDGALDALLGKEHAQNIRSFAADLAYLGDVGKEGAIVAAQYAAHPISKAGARARMGFTANMFSNQRVMRYFANGQLRKATAENARSKLASAFDGAMTGIGFVNRAGRQVAQTSFREQQFGPGLQSQPTQPVQISQPVQSSGIGAVDVTEPVAPVAPTPPTSTRSPLQTMAATDPEVARTLGIGFKNLELLNK